MTPQNKNSFALLVHACDRYEFLYKGFEIFFNEYWDKNVGTINYFATEEKVVKIEPFTNILSGKGEWSDRLIKILRDDIVEDYVIYFQEDMWLSKPVPGQVVRDLMDYAANNNINCIKLHSSEVYETIPVGIDFSGLALTRLDNQKSRYLMSHQVSIWNRIFLLKQLEKNENPWRNERRATKRLKKSNPLIHHVDLFAENGKVAINDNSNNSIRSEYYTVSGNGMLGENVAHALKKLADSVPHNEYYQKLKHHYDNKLTHDGQPKPMKEDIFQKIKRWYKQTKKKSMVS